MKRKCYVLPPKKTLIYQKDSGTIRQMPENYMVAVNMNGRWVLDFDSACNQRLVTKVLLRLFQYEYTYGTGENLIQFLND
jgi:hypothetical protein